MPLADNRYYVSVYNLDCVPHAIHGSFDARSHVSRAYMTRAAVTWDCTHRSNSTSRNHRYARVGTRASESSQADMRDATTADLPKTAMRQRNPEPGVQRHAAYQVHPPHTVPHRSCRRGQPANVVGGFFGGVWVYIRNPRERGARPGVLVTVNAAACYSPTSSRVQYHRRARP